MSEDLRGKRKKLILELFKDDMYVPMKRKELAIFMQVTESKRSEFDSLLDEMINEGSIIITPRGKLLLNEDQKASSDSPKRKALNSKHPTFSGIFRATQRGFGFVEVEGLTDDFYISPENSLNACHEDTVTIEVIKQKTKENRAEARIIEITKRGKDTIVGTYQASSKGFGFVVCDDKKFTDDVFIPIEFSKGAVEGSKVIVKLTDYGNERHKPEGKVTEIIGHVNDPGVDILSIIMAMGIEPPFPEKVLNQAEKNSNPVTEADMAGREDLRNLQMVTIDSEDAKDLDDAVSLEMKGELYELGVHIADVSNYVQESSALDREALKRGTSVYLADRVVPMLPHVLSNGICSLNQKEDRLALSCIMDIDNEGKVVDYKIVESVINVNRRMSYTKVNKIIEEKDAETISEYEELAPMFMKMNELAYILRTKRKKRGSIDFDVPETKILLDEEGKPIDIKPYDRNEATKLIEEFMLVANETVASHFYWLELPFVYRIHEAPTEDKLEKLKIFIKNFGLRLKTGEEIHPKEVQKLLTKIQGSDEEAMISRMTLRSMQQAKYSTECKGHFGLACEYYCHFTSPIRRYPDLQIHRIIKDQLRGRLTPEKISHYSKILDEVCAKTSKLERRADEAERETNKLKKAEFMQKHLYEIFEGVISGITNWGIYVELPNTVEGLVHVSSMSGDYYRFDESRYELVGEGTGKTFKLGEKIKIMVNDVDLSERTIDFVLADIEENGPIRDFYKNGRNSKLNR